MNIDDEFEDQQRWIDDLLRRGTADASEVPLDTLRASLRTAIARRRHTRLLAGGLTAAATLLIAAGWVALDKLQHTTDVEQRVATSHEKSSPAATIPQSETNRATFVSNGESIAVPMESTSADVTIVQLYPTTDTEQRWRRELTMTSIHSDSNGG